MSNTSANDNESIIVVPPEISLSNIEKSTVHSSSQSLDPLHSKKVRRPRRIRNRLSTTSIQNGVISHYYRQDDDCDFFATIDTNACKSYAEYKKTWENEMHKWELSLERTSTLVTFYDRLYRKDGDKSVQTWSHEEEYWLRVFRRKFGISLQHTAMLLGRTLLSVKRKCISVEETTGEVI